MSHVLHHAIVLTTYDEKRIRAARRHAIAREMSVSDVVRSPFEVYYSLLIGPDGSGEGWPDSDKGDRKRDEFLAWLDAQRFEDGSSPYYWFVVRYGDEPTRIEAHYHERKRRKAPKR